MLHCWFSASMYLHSSTYTGDDNFYLLCILNQSLTQLLHCNACCMEHLGHENLSLCVLSTFSTYHWRTYLLFLSILWLNLIPNLFALRHLPVFLWHIEWHCIARTFIILWHAITKDIFTCIDKQWYQCLIDLIAYNITTAFSIIAWHLLRDHHLFILIVNRSVICLCPWKSLVVTPFWPNFNIFIICF